MTDLTLTNPTNNPLARAGAVANTIAGRQAFSDYQLRKAKKTLARQQADLALFADYLRACSLAPGDFYQDPGAWSGVSWGLVSGFVRWMLQESYAVGSINVRLSTIKAYAGLALQAGILDTGQYAGIMTVKGYRLAEGKHADEGRESVGLDTRRSTRRRAITHEGKAIRNRKKIEPVSLSPEQARELKAQPDSPQGRRDQLMMCLFLDLGLRVGEVAILTVDNFNLKTKTLTFYRPKVDKVQTHKLTLPDDSLLEAARAYLVNDAPALGSIWRQSASKKDGKAMQGQLTGPGMSTRAITERVKALGKAIGVAGLSAHDLRHYWATQAARNGTQVDRLQDAGGWSSPAMPLRYIEAAKIANEGIHLN